MKLCCHKFGGPCRGNRKVVTTIILYHASMRVIFHFIYLLYYRREGSLLVCPSKVFLTIIGG